MKKYFKGGLFIIGLILIYIGGTCMMNDLEILIQGVLGALLCITNADLGTYCKLIKASGYFYIWFSCELILICYTIKTLIRWFITEQTYLDEAFDQIDKALK